jgi:hypothetical protein
MNMDPKSMSILSMALLAAIIVLSPMATADGEGDPAVLRGRTLDAFQDPLPGVLVVLDSGENTTSGDTGYFMVHTTQGSHTIHFYKKNYTTEKEFVSIQGAELDMGYIQLRGDINPDQNMIFAIFVGCSVFIVLVVAVVWWRKD